MGSYSYYVQEHITIKDKRGFKKYLKDCANNPYFRDYKEIIEGMLKKREDCLFEDWDDIKLISYWYDEEVKFFDGLGKFLEGFIEWNFENPTESAEILFEKKKTIFNLGVMKYDRYSAKDLLRENEEIINKIEELN
jgi:hypothetical protein